MALGFISKSSYPTQVDVGYGYYMELLRGSFFQEEWEEYNFVKRCKMHDLATQVGGTTYALLKANKECNGDIDGSTRHVSFDCHLDSLQQIRIARSPASKIRTVILPRQSSKITQGRSCDQSVCDEVFSSHKSARVLDLYNFGIKVVPRCVGKLKHLRLLTLGCNEDIKALPDCITMLYNLQTFILYGCKNLQTLPRNMERLVNLVNLDTEDCKSLTHMPQGFNKLTKLQFLTHFVLKSTYSGGDQIGWYSEVENAEYDKNLPLYLKNVDYEETLEGLQPHQNLRGLSLEYYEGVRFSSWLPSLANLEYLEILNNRSCQYLPPFNQFLSLKLLKIVKVVGLEYISENSSSSCTTIPLPSLEAIYFESLPNLKGWYWREDEEGGQADHSSSTSTISFPRLSEFIVYGCPRLTFLPLSPHLKSLTVGKNNWKPFQQAIMANIGISSLSSSSSLSFSNLTDLGLYEIEDLQCLPEWFQNLTSIQVLVLARCHNLKCLFPGIQHFVSSLQELRICACNELEMYDSDDFPWNAFENLRVLLLKELSEMVNLPEGLKHVKSLQYLKVHYCENLIGIPDWIRSLKSLNELSIDGCPNLTSLPEGISQLTSLQELKITYCSEILLRKCRRGKGED
ncbi:putative disease resistance protein At3g14460 [Ziziphus jujuba]|uniref:Disease resistance protein At3g14460 n=1 Tax=Ziziphus jujuba TaxID=326968 RepID=A0ABM4A148_ZIZJJ|nr:putative disease resistance protein At3g14460 [Ziziphus jujuba]